MENTFKSTKETRAKEAFAEVKLSNFKANRFKAAVASSVGVGLSVMKMKSDPRYSKGAVLVAAGFGCFQVVTLNKAYTPEDSEVQTMSSLGGRLIGSALLNRVVGAMANKFMGPAVE